MPLPSRGILRAYQKSIEQLSEAALKFSLQLTINFYCEILQSKQLESLSAEQVLVYAMIDNRLSREACYPASTDDLSDVDQFPHEAMRAIRHFEPVLTDPEASRAHPSNRNSMYVPMVGTQNRFMGLIEFRKKSHGAFFQHWDLRLAICLARIATSAVDRARLFGRIEDGAID